MPVPPDFDRCFSFANGTRMWQLLTRTYQRISKVKYLLILDDMGALVMGAPEKYDATYYGDEVCRVSRSWHG
jgi:hypothetical protein